MFSFPTTPYPLSSRFQQNNAERVQRGTAHDIQPSSASFQLLSTDQFFRNPDVVRFSGGAPKTERPKLSEQDKIHFQELQKQAQRKRGDMPLLLQALFPLHRETAGIKEMQTIEANIGAHPLYRELYADLPPETERLMFSRFSSFEKLMESSKKEDRVYAAQIAKALHEPRLRDMALHQLSFDIEKDVRCAALENIDSVRAATLRDDMVEQLIEDSNQSVRHKANRSIHHMSPSPRRDALILRLAKDNDWTKRDAAAHAISLLKPSDQRDRLLQQLCQDTIRFVRRSAAGQLSHIRDAGLRNELLEELCLENDADIQRATTIAKIKNTPPAEQDRVIDSLLQSDNPFTRTGTATMVHLIQNPQLRDQWIQSLSTGTNHHYRAIAAKALPYISDPDCLEKVINALVLFRPHFLERELVQGIEQIQDTSRRDQVIKKLSLENNQLSQATIISLIPFVHSTVLQKSIINKRLQLLTPEVGIPLAKIAPNIQDDDIRDSLIYRLVQSLNLQIKQAAARSVYSVSSPKLRAELVDRLRECHWQSTRLEVERSAVRMHLDDINAITDRWPYVQLLDEVATTSQAPSGVSGTTLFRLMQLISSVGEDAGILKNVCQDFEKVLEHGVNHTEQFAVGGKKPMTRDEMRQYLAGYQDSILKALILTGKNGVLSKFNQKQLKFEDYMRSVESITQDEAVSRLLYDLTKHGHNKDGKLHGHEKTSLVELADIYRKSDERDQLIDALNEMKDSGQINLPLLTRNFVNIFALQCGMDPEEMKTIPAERYDAWDLNHCRLLPIGLEKLTRPYQEQLKGLVEATFRNNYRDYLTDKKTAIGKANAKTQSEFKKAGLDYDKWLDDSTTQSFRHNNRDYEIALWKRNPGHDLFMGNYGKGCISLDGINPAGIVDALNATMTQFAEVKDKASGKTVAYARCVWGTTPKRNQLAFVIDNIHYRYDHQDANRQEFLQAVTGFLDGYSQRVAGKKVNMYLAATCFIKPTNIAQKQLPLNIIGTTSTGQYYLNAINEVDWTMLAGTQTADVFQLTDHPTPSRLRKFFHRK